MRKGLLTSFYILAFSAGVAQAEGSKIVSQSFSVATHDGLTLQGKLDVPKGATKLPVIIILQGAGPLNVDMAVVEHNNPKAVCYKGWENDCRIDKHLAQKLAALGFAVVRLGKRGTWVDENNPNWVRVNYEENSTSTLSARMKDLDALLLKLEKFKEIDINQIHLVGVSEGTIIAQKSMPVLKGRLKSLVLVGAVLGSGLDLYRTQIADISFDLLLKVADKNNNGIISKEEYNLESLMKIPAGYDYFSPAFFRTLKDLTVIGVTPTFAYFDKNQDAFLVRHEVQEKVHKELFERVVSAVQSGKRESLTAIVDDDYSYNYNSLEQFQDWFAEPSKAASLSRSSIPVTVLFGENDYNTSPRQLDWFLPMVWAQNNSKVVGRTVVEEGHYGPKLAEEVISIFQKNIIPLSE